MEMLGRYFSAAASALEFHLQRFWREWLLGLAIFFFIFGGVYYLFLAPPAQFPRGAIIVIARGESAATLASALGTANIVKDPQLLRALLRVSGRAGAIHSGAFRFQYPQNLLTVAYRLIVGDSGIPPVRITFPDGTTARAMAPRVAAALPEISASDFITAAEPYEGYLFPDTYIFTADATADSVVATLRDNFDAKLQPLLPAIAASGHSLSDIVIMASIVEKEARTSADKAMVAGILWNRIKLGMPLQTDVVFGYIFGRETYAPSLVDLTVDSPYNTYTHKGLPPGPIDSPGLASLEAAINPTPSKYLYYLADKNGVMHYATTFAQHEANVVKYLK